MTNNLIDVWDFGAAKLDENRYCNWITTEVVNKHFYGETDVEGVNNLNLTCDFTVGDLSYHAIAKDNRLRTTNERLGRYDQNIGPIPECFKDGKAEDFCGCIYLNGPENQAEFKMNLRENDAVKLYIKFDNSDDYVGFERGSDLYKVGKVSTAGGVVTFVAPFDGTYTLKNLENEGKLRLYRVVRERKLDVQISGNVVEPDNQALKCEITFTSLATNKIYKTKIKNGKFCVSIPSNSMSSEYKIGLAGVNNYVITSKRQFVAGACNKNIDVCVSEVEVVSIRGRIQGLNKKEIEKLKIKYMVTDAFMAPDKCIYEPQMQIESDGTYAAFLEKNVNYHIIAEGINDYFLENDMIIADENMQMDLHFTEKKKYFVDLFFEGISKEELTGAKITFVKLDEEGYEYTFDANEAAYLRDGVYKVSVNLSGDVYAGGKCMKKQKLTSNLKIDGQDASKKIRFEKACTDAFSNEDIAYREVVSVGLCNCDYENIADALNAVRIMDRSRAGGDDGDKKRVTIKIFPGNYEEMLVVDIDNITFANADKNPSIELVDKGVNIADGAVRITSYYGHGCNYYSQNALGKYDVEELEVNKENGYLSYFNGGKTMRNSSYWNATVVVSGKNFVADGIIFENSFNQYVSKKETKDVIELSADNRGGKRPKIAGDISVQKEKFLERAAALALTDTADNAAFSNCRFVGRQDTLYGAAGIDASFAKCKIMGSIDYIFGGMTASFKECDLIFNTSDDDGDIVYITAPQTPADEDGFFMDKCRVISTIPGHDTASEHTAKPGYFGRPWTAESGAAVFNNTIVETTTFYEGEEHEKEISLIKEEGWSDSLAGKSSRCAEYKTTELSKIDSSAKRVNWVKVIT